MAEHMAKCGLCGAFLPLPPVQCNRCSTTFDLPEYEYVKGTYGCNAFGRHFHRGLDHAHDGGALTHSHESRA